MASLQSQGFRRKAAQTAPRVEAPFDGFSDLPGRLRYLFSEAPLIVGLVVLALVTGFFHGWMKLEIRNPIVVFAFDIPIVLSLLALIKQVGWKHLVPRDHPVFIGFKLYLWTCLLFALVPWGPAPVISLAGLRAWTFAPLTLLIGYHAFRDLQRMNGLVLILCLLSVIVTIIGVNQDLEEVLRRMEEDPYYATRYYNTFHWTPETGAILRVFSTFVSAAGFGSALALTNVLIGALFIVRDVEWRVRWPFIGCFIFFTYGIFLSGSRSAIIVMVVGLVTICLLRPNRSKRDLILLVGIATLILVSARIAFVFTEGEALTRYGEGLSPETIVNRNQIPLFLGIKELAANPIGHGLGRSGHGVPFFLLTTTDEEFKGIDGDIGRLMVDMGVAGVLTFGILLRGVGVSLYRGVRETQSSDERCFSALGLAVFLMSVISIPSGSPYLGIPNGVLTWLIVGGALGNLDARSSQDAVRRGRFRQSRGSFAWT